MFAITAIIKISYRDQSKVFNAYACGVYCEKDSNNGLWGFTVGVASQRIGVCKLYFKL